MKKTGITNIEFKNMMLNAASTLNKNKDYVDSLNVFPVPDGDTGTNMNLTMKSVVKEIENANDDFKSISDAIALGSLKGARGNSGVILSQILKGFSSQTGEVDTVIDVAVLTNALNKSSELAYKAVMKPKEGTILTVCKSLANAASAQKTDDVIEFFENILASGKETLEKTPDMLPILKEAGVVDSGGTGLIVIITGILNFLKGEDVDIDFAQNSSTPATKESKIPKLEYDFSDEHIHSKFSYCTEFLINGVEGEHNDELRSKLEKIGDCVLVVGDSEILKVHVHTDNPGQALEYALEIGYLNDIKIENMDEQRKKTKKQSAPVSPRKSIALICVSVGDGIDEVFTQLNTDVIIKGGQSMNPSVEDFMAAVDSVRSENIIILPNNKNIVLACEQVAEVSNKNVKVVATHSIPQGINAAMVFNSDASIEDNVAAMKDAIEEVHSIQITKAVRTTSINDMQISEGDYIAILNGDIKAKGYYINDAVLACLNVESLAIEDQSITLFYGDGANKTDAEKLSELIEEKYPDVEVDVAYGGQPLYPYIISVE